MNLNCFFRLSKLGTLLYFVVILFIGFATFAQTVTFKATNVPLDKVLQVVKQQTGYEVLGTKDLLTQARAVSINAKNIPLRNFLDSVFVNQQIGYNIVDKTIVLEPKKTRRKDNSLNPKPVVPIVQHQVTGQVIGTDQSPLPGTTIISGGKAIAVADQDGRFVLNNIKPNTQLLLSRVGYESGTLQIQEGKYDYLVQLKEESNALNQVVITGYQTINRESYTGSVVTKSGEELRQVNPQNVLQAIQVFDPSFKIMENNLAGGNPNALPTINVRGSSSLPTGSNEVLRRDNINSMVNMPAFILDGFEVNVQKVLDLDMTRIESVTLLKDAAATAIYGSRAANGVMVIITKSPKDGKLRLSYTHESNINTPDLTDYNVLNAADKLEYERLAGLYTSSVQRQSQDLLDELYYHKLANVIGGVDTYWLSQPLRTAVGQKHGLFVEGGSEVFRYGVDLRYQTRPGVMKESGRNQYSGGVNFSYSPNDRLRFQNELSITSVEGRESPYGSFASYVRMNPYYRMTDDNGNIVQRTDSWTRVASSGHQQIESVLNPLYDATLSGFYKTGYLEVMDNFSGDFDLGKGLRLRGQVGLMKRMNTHDDFRSPFANEFFYYETSRTDEKGSYTSYSNNELYWDANLRINWLRNFGKHNVNMVAGANLRTENSDQRWFTAIGFPNDRFTSIGFAKGYAENSRPSSSLQASRLFGTFASVNYSYDNRYLLDATIRTDGSSKFGANNRIAPFWSAGVGWNAHREQWFTAGWISQLRVRATTGLTGSVQFTPYMSRTTYTYDQSNRYSSGIGALVGNYGNSSLTWQKTQSTDVSLDLGFWGDRVVISPRYYYKMTKDILADINLVPSTGFDTYKENLGDMENKGIELNFNWGVVRKKDWTVNLTANFVRNENKIVRISNALKTYNDRANDAQDRQDLMGVPLLRYNEGQSLDAIYAVPSLGIDPESGREVFLTRSGNLSYDWNARDIQVVGVATPKMEGFWGGTVRYKQWMVVAYFQTRLGGDLYNQTLVDRVENADPRYNVDQRVLEDKWKNPGDVSFYKSIQDLGMTKVSSRFVMPENMLALQSLFLSYDVSTNWIQNYRLSSLRVGATANDLFRWSSIKQERGIDYPFARSVSINLQASF